MILNTCFVEGLCPLANTLVRVLAIEEVYLLETTAVCFNAVKTSHLDDSRGHLYQLIYAGLILASTLPHVAEDQTKLNFFLHLCYLDFFTFSISLNKTPLLYLLCRGNMTLTTSYLADNLLKDSHSTSVNNC